MLDFNFIDKKIILSMDEEVIIETTPEEFIQDVYRYLFKKKDYLESLEIDFIDTGKSYESEYTITSGWWIFKKNITRRVNISYIKVSIKIPEDWSIGILGSFFKEHDKSQWVLKSDISEHRRWEIYYLSMIYLYLINNFEIRDINFLDHYIYSQLNKVIGL